MEEDDELDEDEGYLYRLGNLSGEAATSAEDWPACLAAIARVKAMTGRCLPGLTVRITAKQIESKIN